MGTNNIAIEIKNSVEEAPNYNAPEYLNTNHAFLEKAIIVRNGTEAGNDTVDLQFKDTDGKIYVAMITGRLLKSVAQVVNVHE